jgi:small subunit ribosomal protein S21
MLYIKVEGNIEKALKTYKYKVFKTKIHDELRERKEFKKKSVERREILLKAKHKQYVQTKEEA